MEEYGFLSNYWDGLKTIQELNGSRHKYRGIYVDVVDIHTKKKIGRMNMGAALRKFQ